MRILLRIIAIGIGIAVIWTLWTVWRFWHFDHFASPMTTKLFAILTLVGWGIDLIVGAFAAIQLWRLRESGRRSSLLLVGYGVFYYIASGLSVRQSGIASHLPWSTIASNAALALLLLSPLARRVCQPETL